MYALNSLRLEKSFGIGYEPIWAGPELVGFVTSGGYGHCAEMSIAMGYLKASVADDESALSVTILGDRRGCRILKEAPIDPRNVLQNSHERVSGCLCVAAHIRKYSIWCSYPAFAEAPTV